MWGYLFLNFKNVLIYISIKKLPLVEVSSGCQRLRNGPPKLAASLKRGEIYGYPMYRYKFGHFHKFYGWISFRDI